RYYLNERNIGLIENFNRVLQLARGSYFRWIGNRDTVGPRYAEKCVAALDATPEAVALTTLWQFVEEDGRTSGSTQPGPRLAERDPSRRMWRFLWYMDEDRALFDPIYSAMRMDALARTRRLRIEQYADRVLALELALLGPFAHLD